uniref:Uncharacterized protein n=1 Tax=Setaria italica TaxID=4555 RepID=K3YNY8_SETIT
MLHPPACLLESRHPCIIPHISLVFGLEEKQKVGDEESLDSREKTSG